MVLTRTPLGTEPRREFRRLLDLQHLGPLLLVPEILELLTLSRSCLHDQIAKQALPPLAKLGSRTARWPAALIAALLANRSEIRDGMSYLRQPVVMPDWRDWWPTVVTGGEEYDIDVRDLQLLTAKQVADQLRISVPTVYRYVRYQGLPGPLPLTVKARRWLRREVDQWSRSCIAVSLRISGELPVARPRDKTRPSGQDDRPRT